MKKISIVLTMLSALLLFTSCRIMPSVETITKEAGNHIYKKGDNIEIIDIETNECIATLRIDDYKLLIDSPFTVQEYKGKDEYENDIYEYDEYNQLLQITYTFINSPGYDKDITVSNFEAYDSVGKSLTINPHLKDIELNIDYSNSITIASVLTDSHIDLRFTYDKYQYRHTAKIELSKNDLNFEDNPESDNGHESGNSSEQSSSDFSSRNDTSNNAPMFDGGNSNSGQIGNSGDASLGIAPIYIVIISVLSAAVIILAVLLVISYANRRHKF